MIKTGIIFVQILCHWFWIQHYVEIVIRFFSNAYLAMLRLVPFWDWYFQNLSLFKTWFIMNWQLFGSSISLNIALIDLFSCLLFFFFCLFYTPMKSFILIFFEIHWGELQYQVTNTFVHLLYVCIFFLLPAFLKSKLLNCDYF